VDDQRSFWRREGGKFGLNMTESPTVALPVRAGERRFVVFSRRVKKGQEPMALPSEATLYFNSYILQPRAQCASHGRCRKHRICNSLFCSLKG